MKLRFWKRESAGSELPPEVQEYYASTKRAHFSVAFLLSLATMVLTFILTLGIFYGGRYVYRQFSGQQQPEITTIDRPTEPQKATEPSQSEEPAPATASAPERGEPEVLPADETEPATDEITEPEQPRTSSRQRQTAATRTPDTGPGNIIAIFVLTSVAGAVAHELYTAKVANKRG